MRGARTLVGALLLLAAGCTGLAPGVPVRGDATTPPAGGASEATDAAGEAVPTRRIRVAYPDSPAAFVGLDPRDPAAVDLAALWGLPLYRVDPAGQWRPGLAVAATETRGDDGWQVEVDLAAGAWSDGAPVTSADVVATAEALRAARPDAWAGVGEVVAVDVDTVRIDAPAPVGTWPALLSGAPGVLPAHVLAEGGLDAFRDEVPVSGGWFRVVDAVEGRSVTLDANPRSPLGPPGAEGIDVDVVPSYETALGLLSRGEVDAVVGHAALNPVVRAARLDEVRAEAPLGGTWVGLAFDEPGGVLTGPDRADDRRRIVEALDLTRFIEGLLADAGGVLTSPVPGVDGPWTVGTGTPPLPSRVSLPREPVLLLPRGPDISGLTGRTVQREASLAGVTLRLVGVSVPDSFDPVDEVDARLVVVRSLPSPDLTWLLGEGGAGDDVTTVARSAAAGAEGTAEARREALAPGFAVLRDAAVVTPLYRVGIAHAWHPRLTGVRPSAWAGAGFWDAGAWRVEG
ncbi:MAG: ABC transporter substrate-binding protein [Actinomycetes bacterium]